MRGAGVDVALVFLAIFAANLVRNYFFSVGSPQPATSIALWTQIAIGFALPLALQAARHRPLSELGLAPVRNARAALPLLAYVLILSIAGTAVRVSSGGSLIVRADVGARIAIGLAAEELAFRGLIQTRFERMLGTSPAILGASALFGLVHIAVVLQQGIAGAANAMAATALLGVLLGLTFAKTRSLLLVWLGHAVYDLVPGGLVFGR